jgi:hypothetical protein
VSSTPFPARLLYRRTVLARSPRAAAIPIVQPPPLRRSRSSLRFHRGTHVGYRHGGLRARSTSSNARWCRERWVYPMCGWALASDGRPCVAQRVWPMPVVPASASPFAKRKPTESPIGLRTGERTVRIAGATKSMMIGTESLAPMTDDTAHMRRLLFDPFADPLVPNLPGPHFVERRRNGLVGIYAVR